MVLPLTTASMHTDENKKTKIKFGTQLRKHYYCFHMDLRKVSSTRVDEPGLNLGRRTRVEPGSSASVSHGSKSLHKSSEL